MKVGLLFSHRNPPALRVPWPQVYRETLALVELAEKLGFDGVFATEHHFAEDGYSPSVLPILASWAVRTERVDLGSYVLLLPLHDPLRVAEDVATVDIMSGGRLILGLGLGYRQEEFAGSGLDRGNAGERMDEALEVVLRAWSEPSLTFAGKHYRYADARLEPKPVQQPRPRVWLSTSGRPGARRVAKWGLEGFAGAPGAETYDLYRERCRDYGTTARAESQLLLFGHVAEDDETAWQEAEPYATHVHEVYRDWARAAGNERTFRGTPRESMVFGSPETWLSRIEAGIEAAVPRPTYVIVQLHLAGMPFALARRSMELFAERVLPRLDRT